jgi:L-fuconolactonase
MTTTTRVIDSHQHFWRYTPEEYGWIDESMPRLRADFLPADLHVQMRAAGVDAAVAVQARQDVEETRWLLELAEGSPFLAGVVGWAPIASPEFPLVLESLRSSAKLKGLRHIVQAEADEQFMLRDSFRDGIRELTRSGLVYDILIFPPQLPQAIAFADAHPQQSFVLDHAAKPPLRGGDLVEWERGFRLLAQRENVCCKLSGLVTEADWSVWTEESLHRIFDVMLEAFGPGRMLAGSDWPVCTLASEYTRWWALVRGWVNQLSNGERALILGGNAERIYKLDTRKPG